MDLIRFVKKNFKYLPFHINTFKLLKSGFAIPPKLLLYLFRMFSQGVAIPKENVRGVARFVSAKQIDQEDEDLVKAKKAALDTLELQAKGEGGTYPLVHEFILRKLKKLDYSEEEEVQLYFLLYALGTIAPGQSSIELRKKFSETPCMGVTLELKDMATKRLREQKHMFFTVHLVEDNSPEAKQLLMETQPRTLPSR